MLRDSAPRIRSPHGCLLSKSKLVTSDFKFLFAVAAFLNPCAAHATYFVAGFSAEYAVVAIDSRMLLDQTVSDHYCKIRPLSKNAFFFARGSTSAFDDEEKKNVFDARDIAQGVFTRLGSDASTAELAQVWAEQIKFIYEKRPIEFSRSAVDGLMTDGFFVGMDAGGKVTFSGQSIRYQQRDKARFFARPEPVVFSDPSAGPRYVSGYQDLLREFRNGGKTKRAKMVLSRLDPAQRGPDAVAARYSAFVGAVRDWTGDQGIGGDIATIILERGKGWRWFHRPDFCPEN
jgi:hypothetical protein